MNKLWKNVHAIFTLIFVVILPFNIHAAICQDRLFNDGCSIPMLARILSTGALEYAMDNFHEACVRHDYCYHHSFYTYYGTRKMCDDDFNADMATVCNNKPLAERGLCHGERKTVYGAVDIAGGSSFLGDQCNVDGTYCEYEGIGFNTRLDGFSREVDKLVQAGKLSSTAEWQINLHVAQYVNPDNNYRCGNTASDCEEIKPLKRRFLLKEDALFYQLLQIVDMTKWEQMRDARTYNGQKCEMRKVIEDYPESSREGEGKRWAEVLYEGTTVGLCGEKARRGVCVGARATRDVYDDWKEAFWASWNDMTKCVFGADDDSDGIANSCDECPTYADPTNQCGFEDKTGQAGLHNHDHSIGAAWDDYDNDGDLDIFLKSVDMSNNTMVHELLQNSWTYYGFRRFSDVATPILQSAGNMSMPPVWGDYNNDGLSDLFVGGSIYPRTTLLRNAGDGVLVDASGELPELSTGSARGIWLDYNNDGNLDLYAVQIQPYENKLFLNSINGFVDVTSEIPSAIGGATWVDYDNDGDLDLCAESNIYRNDEATGFVDMSAELLSDAPNFSCAGVWGDYNNDGYLDLFVSSQLLLYRNRGADSFYPDEAIIYGRAPYPIYPTGFRAATWGDFDNDGLLDLFVVRDSYSELHHILFKNIGGGQFADVTSKLIGVPSHGNDAIWGDYDNDGDLDLYLTNSRPAVGHYLPSTLDNRLFSNLSPNENHWLQVNLEGTVSNASGIGAHILLTQQWRCNPISCAGSFLPYSRRTQLREVSGQTGDAKTAHFGLGPSLGDAPISIEVRWPSGAIQTLPDITPNQKITIIEEVAEEEPILGDLDGDSNSDAGDFRRFGCTFLN